MKQRGHPRSSQLYTLSLGSVTRRTKYFPCLFSCRTRFRGISPGCAWFTRMCLEPLSMQDPQQSFHALVSIHLPKVELHCLSHGTELKPLTLELTTAKTCPCCHPPLPASQLLQLQLRCPFLGLTAMASHATSTVRRSALASHCRELLSHWLVRVGPGPVSNPSSYLQFLFNESRHSFLSLWSRLHI